MPSAPTSFLLTSDKGGPRPLRAEALFVIAFNVSSRYFELAPVVAASAAELGLFTVQRQDLVVDEAEHGKHASIWVVDARQRSAIDPFLSTGRWRRARGAGAGWTDAFSNPLHALIW